jgi:sialate O-acetylesterase
MKTAKTAAARGAARIILMSTLAVTVVPLAAGVRMPTVFTDHMMLQRDRPVRVWGWADAGEAVEVKLAGAVASGKADGKGQWMVELPAMKAGENLELTVTAGNTVTLRNLIVGDIWVCSGQSNMEMTLNGCVGAEEDAKGAHLPTIRRIKFNHVVSGVEEDNAPAATQWQVCTPETAPGFTAVGFYFAREIVKRTGVPVGIVDANWGGTPIEPWIATAGLAGVTALKPQYEAKLEAIRGYRAQLPKALESVEAWVAQTRRDLDRGAPVSTPPSLPGPPDAGWSGMYNAMIHPIVNLPIRGALWYQGESNGAEGESYYQKMDALIGGWRKQWGQGDFPFYFVQLASFQAVTDDAAGGNGWAQLREAQRKALQIPNTGMAVITDTVPLPERDDIHPRNKSDVGLRLAQWALGRDYGLKDTVVSGPLLKGIESAGGKVRVKFEHTGGGLMAGRKDGLAVAAEDAGAKLNGFAVAGADRKWVWADAVIDGDTVVVSAGEVKEPVAVRYAYRMNPGGANLYNRAGLPASPFRSDDW